jgi:mediator of RNA polymerase II transcription subunit 27
MLKGLMIEWVQIKSFTEDFTGEDGKLDIWTDSRYKVFRKVTEHANSAMLHFSSPIYPELGVKSFLVSTSCIICIKYAVRSSKLLVYSVEEDTQ